MENRSDILMLSGVARLCADCGAEAIFVPVEEGCDHDGCEFCCTACDAAVFLMPVLENTGRPVARVA